ncbi:MAG: tol-pal system-associated acyl-CoA thioesterase [Parasutterella sp.]
MERARTEWLRALGWVRSGCTQSSASSLASPKPSQVQRNRKLDDELVVRSTVTACGRTSFEFHQEILRGDEVLNVGDVRCGTLDAHTFRPMAMPEPISEQLKKLLNH